MNTEKKPFFEAKALYRMYCQLKPYFLFQSFLESLKSDSNTTLVESIQKGVNAVLEDVASALQESDPQSYAWLKESERVMNSIKASIKNKNVKENRDYQRIKLAALKLKLERENPNDERLKDDTFKILGDDDPKIILLQSVYSGMASFVDYYLDKLRLEEQVGEEDAQEAAEHTMKELQNFVLNTVIPKFDPDEHGGISFQQYAIGPTLKGKASGILSTYLESPVAKKWITGKEYKIKEDKEGLVDYQPVRHNGKYYKRIGEIGSEIPPDLVNIPPNLNKDFWEQSFSDEGKLATSPISKLEKTGEEDREWGETAVGKLLSKSIERSEKPFTKESEESNKRKFYDRIEAIAAGIISRPSQRGYFKENESEKENIPDYFRELFMLAGEDPTILNEKNPSNIGAEKVKELRKKYFSSSDAAVENALSRIKTEIIDKMHTMGKSRFPVSEDDDVIIRKRKKPVLQNS